jgi:hypothetical protein
MKTRTSLAAVGVATVLAGGGALLALPAAASSATHTLTFIVHSQSQANFGKNGGATFDHDVNAKGTIIGYDVVSFGHGDHGNVAVALQHGFVYASLVFGKNGSITGKLAGGTGAWTGVTGTVKGTQVSKKKTDVTITYSH